jgi:Domain of unknown function (DUF4864)
MFTTILRSTEGLSLWRLAVQALAVVAGCALALHASAAPVAPTEEKKIRMVVQGQLDAFEKNDARAAFSFAAPNVREAVGTAEKFMNMVRTGYPQVYRHTAVVFLKPEMVGDEVLQRVQLTDASGEVWLASYALQKQKDMSWRITACVVTENKGRFV